jgi:hypothetical protein
MKNKAKALLGLVSLGQVRKLFLSTNWKLHLSLKKNYNTIKTRTVPNLAKLNLGQPNLSLKNKSSLGKFMLGQIKVG